MAGGLLARSDREGRRVLGRHPDGRVEAVLDAAPSIDGNVVGCDGAPVHGGHGDRRLALPRTVARCLSPTRRARKAATRATRPGGGGSDPRTGAGIRIPSAEGQRPGLIPAPQGGSHRGFGPGEARPLITAIEHRGAIDLGTAPG